jgi:hypothetical protein
MIVTPLNLVRGQGQSYDARILCSRKQRRQIALYEEDAGTLATEAKSGVNPTESENVRGGEGVKAEQTNARNILPRLPQGAGSNLKSYSPTQLHFLMRLSHLQRQRRDMVKTPDGNDWHMRLVNKALYSTYRDCEDLGVGEEARLLMAQQAPERHSA